MNDEQVPEQEQPQEVTPEAPTQEVTPEAPSVPTQQVEQGTNPPEAPQVEEALSDNDDDNSNDDDSTESENDLEEA
jgi:hypothetical protein